MLRGRVHFDANRGPPITPRYHISIFDLQAAVMCTPPFLAPPLRCPNAQHPVYSTFRSIQRTAVLTQDFTCSLTQDSSPALRDILAINERILAGCLRRFSVSYVEYVIYAQNPSLRYSAFTDEHNRCFGFSLWFWFLQYIASTYFVGRHIKNIPGISLNQHGDYTTARCRQSYPRHYVRSTLIYSSHVTLISRIHLVNL